MKDKTNRFFSFSCFSYFFAWFSWCNEIHQRPTEYNLKIVLSSQLRKASRACRHLILSPPHDFITEDMDLSKVYDLCSKHLKKFMPDVLGGEIVFHPFRLKDEIKTALRSYTENKKHEKPSYSSGGFWKLARDDVLGLGSLDEYREFSTHFHIICFGYFPKADLYHEVSGGWIYKNKRDIDMSISANPDGTHSDSVKQVFSYLLTHCAIQVSPESGKATKTHRSYGLMSPRFFRLDVGFSFSLYTVLLCPDCLEKDGEETPLQIEMKEEGVVYETYFDDTHMCNVTTDETKRIYVRTEIPNYVLHNPVEIKRSVRKKFAAVFKMIYDRRASV